MKNVRETVLKILYEIEYNGAYSNMAVKAALHGDMSPREKAFASALVYGIIDKKLTLDYIISQFCRVKPKKLSKYIRLILRMGVYQIKFMDSVPNSAAVNESVKLARRYGHSASAGLVNGVLRTVTRERVSYPENVSEKLSVMYSYPQWLVDKWLAEFGEEFTVRLIEGFCTPPRLTLRPNTLKTTASELVRMISQKGIFAEEDGGAVICGGFDVADDELYKSGMYTVQDKAAMCAAEVLAPKAGETVIDMCAAPGGKTTHMAELMENTGTVYAFDKFEHKIRLIEANAKRLGIKIIKPALSDASEYNPAFAQSADRILCDVPCSGTGILRRKPDIKWNREQSGDFTALQKQILENAVKYLKRGGSMVYSTCSIEREENEGVTSGCGLEKEFEKTFYPHIDHTDGFYICKLKKL